MSLVCASCDSVFIATKNQRKNKAYKNKYCSKPCLIKGRTSTRYGFVTLAERLAANSVPEPMSGCIIWLGYVGDNGYANIGSRGKYSFAHRAAYELAKGPIPKGLQIDHLCRIRCCINPNHLEAVTCLENINRGLQAKKTHCIRGHVMAGRNVLWCENPKGKKTLRACKACRKLRYRAHKT